LEKQVVSQANNPFPFDKLEALREQQPQSKTTSLEHLQALNKKQGNLLSFIETLSAGQHSSEKVNSALSHSHDEWNAE
jgi:hypothetical protein